MKKHKHRGVKAPTPPSLEEHAEQHALQYRLEELLMVCEGIAIGMSNDFVYEIWGKLRFAPTSDMVRLSAAPGDMREAIRMALLAAQELAMPHLIQVRTPHAHAGPRAASIREDANE